MTSASQTELPVATDELIAALKPFADQAATFDNLDGIEFVPDNFMPAINEHTIGDLRRARALLARLEQAEARPVDETAWLVELGGATPSWWSLTLDEEPGWERDVNKALRFARKEDADAYIYDTGWTDAFASEHIWTGPSVTAPVLRPVTEQMVEVLKAARAGVKPFADAVFNDNGDMTVDMAAVSYDDFCNAYFIEKKIGAVPESGESAASHLADMAAVGESLMAAIEAIQHDDSPYKDWAPAEDPAEIVIDLFNDLMEARAGYLANLAEEHRQTADMAEALAKCQRERDEHLRLKNELVLKAYPAMDAVDEARHVLAAWDINSLPNDISLVDVATARIDDLCRSMDRAEAAERLVASQADQIRRKDEALRLAVEYDDILLRFKGPAVIFDGDVAVIDAAYDKWVSAARAALLPEGKQQEVGQ